MNPPGACPWLRVRSVASNSTHAPVATMKESALNLSIAVRFVHHAYQGRRDLVAVTRDSLVPSGGMRVSRQCILRVAPKAGRTVSLFPMAPIRMGWVLALLGLVSLPTSGWAQYRFDHFTTSNGLPQNTVSAIA